MHEMGIANSILEAVKAEAIRYPGAGVSKVAVRIGQLAAVDPDALRFCFEALTKETEFESLTLEIEFCPRRQRCPACGAEFDAKDYEFHCLLCGEEHTECIGGDQLELAYLELEEYDSSTA